MITHWETSYIDRKIEMILTLYVTLIHSEYHQGLWSEGCKYASAKLLK